MKLSEGSELVRFHGCESPTAWEGLYQNYDDWKRIVCPESYSHPAKMSPVLCEKIFEHLELLNLIDHETSTVVDFMSGTATTNIIAGIRGYRSVSVELEPRFVRMQMKNREGLAAYTGKEPEWKIMQGDARNLSKMFNGGDNIGVMSPPYGKGDDRLKNPIPPYFKNPGLSHVIRSSYETSNLKSKGQIQNLPVKAGVISPPYETMRIADGEQQKELVKIHGKEWGRHSHEKKGWGLYSINPSNIGNLRAGITSPPYADMISGSSRDPEKTAKGWEKAGKKAPKASAGSQVFMKMNYGSEGNLGNQSKEDYSSAMLRVYSEARKAGISPLVTVTKNPTRKGKLVRLDLMTADLLTRAGYELFDYHQATLVNIQKEREITLDFSGPSERTTAKGRLGFFKRLQLQKGGIVAQWEDVIFASIPN